MHDSFRICQVVRSNINIVEDCQTFAKIIRINKALQVFFKFVAYNALILLYSRFFKGSIHAFDLSVSPWLIGEVSTIVRIIFKQTASNAFDMIIDFMIV